MEPNGWEDVPDARNYLKQFILREPGKPVLTKEEHAALLVKNGQVPYELPDEEERKTSHFHALRRSPEEPRCRCGGPYLRFIRDPASVSEKAYAIWLEIWEASEEWRVDQVRDAEDEVRRARNKVKQLNAELM